MKQVANTRIRQGYPIVRMHERNYMALTGPGSCQTIGQWRWVSIDGKRAERKQIVDCSHPNDAYRHKRIGLIGEVSYATAKEHHFIKQGHRPAKITTYKP